MSQDAAEQALRKLSETAQELAVQKELVKQYKAENAELRAEIDSLRSRLEDTTRDKLNAETQAERQSEAASADAERWRFIREKSPTTIRLDGNMRGSGLPVGLIPSYYHADTADELDAAIDQARGVAAGD